MHASTPEILDLLESVYGRQEPAWPTEPYEFLVWWHCGCPASDSRRARGWASLERKIGVTPERVLAASNAAVTDALAPGGMVPELRAARLQQIAARVRDEFSGDLREGLKGPIAGARRTLKRFPGIAGPGAGRILLFAGIAPIAAVP